MLANLVNKVKNNSVQNIGIRMCSQLVKVQVQQGVVIGQKKKLPNGNMYGSFQGVPYAVPPLGDLRYKSPVPLSRFEVPELDCLKERDVSHQRDPFSQDIVGSENCLFLNIYAPDNNEASKSLPVMVFIHGGGFFFGNGNSDYHMPIDLMQENVIVVTLNYRLGALGFLCLPEEGIWGNAGLKDQRLALQWVQANIAQFGGDNNNITLFGESAGAASVHLHVLSKHSNKLFHKAIMQSGAANAEWTFQSNPAYKTRKLAECMGFQNTSNTTEMLHFLQSTSVTPTNILAQTFRVLTTDERRRGLPLPFKPVIEDSSSPDIFIEHPVIERLQKPDSIFIPTIMGYNSAEGLVMLVNAIKKMAEYENDFSRLVPRNIPLPPEDKTVMEIAKKMRDFYLNGKPISPKVLNRLTNLLSDYHFVVDIQKAAELHVRLQPHSPLYFYRFEYEGGRNIYKRILQMDKLDGACHGDELFYLFQMADDSPVSDKDAKFIKQICRLWANFAKYSKPTPSDQKLLINCNWSPVRRPHNKDDKFVLDYLAIDDNGCAMKSQPDLERIEFWEQIYNEYPATDYSLLSCKL